MGWLQVILLAWATAPAEIQADEQVVFYPTTACQLEGGDWEIALHGHVCRPEKNSLRRALLLDVLRLALGLSSEQAENATFKTRARTFLVDNIGGRSVVVRVGEHEQRLGPSGDDGHFTGTLRLPEEEADRLAPATDEADRWVKFAAILPTGDDRVFSGQAVLLDAEGLSVISDIDDTIKHSQVRDRRALLTNTFLKDFAPVPGMADVYSDWAERGAAFHYVSGSPWQLYQPLAAFLASEGFPRGDMHLKKFRLNDLRSIQAFTAQEGYKSAAIGAILERFPRRTFVLVGDSGEQDPEIYGALARKHAEQLVAIAIRNVTGEDTTSERYAEAFAELDRARWRIFTEPQEIGDLLPSTGD